MAKSEVKIKFLLKPKGINRKTKSQLMPNIYIKYEILIDTKRIERRL